MKRTLYKKVIIGRMLVEKTRFYMLMYNKQSFAESLTCSAVTSALDVRYFRFELENIGRHVVVKCLRTFDELF